MHEYNNSDSRLAAVAREYASRPEHSVIVAPDPQERNELTQLVRADLYAQGKLGRDAQVVSVLVEKDTGSKMRVESYQLGDSIHYKTGSPVLDGIPHHSQATVVSINSRDNFLSVRLDATREEVSYNPAKLRTQTRESRVFQKVIREVAEGERIRFTRYDNDLGVRFGDLGTVTRMGKDHSITVKMDSGKIAEVFPEKVQHIDYGYAVGSLKNTRAERIVATGDDLTHQIFRGTSPETGLSLFINAPQQDSSPTKGLQSRNSRSLPSSSMISESVPKDQRLTEISVRGAHASAVRARGTLYLHLPKSRTQTCG